MRSQQLLSYVFIILCLISFVTISGAEVPTMVNLQGMLTDGGGSALPDGSYQVVFTIYNASSGGSDLWMESRTVTTVSGVFSINLGEVTPIAGSIYRNPDLWFGIKVESDPEMTPRQRLTTAPFGYHSLHSDTADFVVNNGSGWIKAGQTVHLGSDLDSVGIGTDSPQSKLHVVGQLLSGVNNSATGGHSTVSGGQSNNASADRSTIGGGFQNSATDTEATIGGGQYNTASGAQSTVSGGHYNLASGWQSTVGGGAIDTASGNYSTVSGGNTNVASAVYSTIGGGTENKTLANSCTIAGGYGNISTGQGGTVGGGASNNAAGNYSTVPGGNSNTAGGYNSFAAGQLSIASHDGSFVWTDNYNMSTFGSAADYEFAIRAHGGVRIVTGTYPTTGVQVAAGSGSWSSLCDRNSKENFLEADLDDILESLASINISSWNYKSQDNSVRHIGPMAQDFYEAFQVGSDNKRITNIDADGIALAAIQALYKRQKQLQQQTEEIKLLQSELKQQKILLEELYNKLQSVSSVKGEH